MLDGNGSHSTTTSAMTALQLQGQMRALGEVTARADELLRLLTIADVPRPGGGGSSAWIAGFSSVVEELEGGLNDAAATLAQQLLVSPPLSLSQDDQQSLIPSLASSLTMEELRQERDRKREILEKRRETLRMILSEAGELRSMLREVVAPDAWVFSDSLSPIDVEETKRRVLGVDYTHAAAV